MNLRYEEKQRRFSEFPDPVRLLAYNVPRVREIIEMYACGEIITMQEALCRMVVELATDTESQRKQMIDMMQRSTLAPVPITPKTSSAKCTCRNKETPWHESDCPQAAAEEAESANEQFNK